jgi:hypothetical protein
VRHISDRSGIADAVSSDLAIEDWRLLATRTISWNEIFSRASMFVIVLSAAGVALALVAQVAGFGPACAFLRCWSSPSCS